MKIGLDAGHGLKTSGKQTPNGIKEWTLNDKVRDKVVAYLKDYDVEIINTDNDEGNVDEGLTTRRTMYVNAKVDAFVSIHHNAYTGSWNNVTGVEVYTDRNQTSADTRLAQAIYKNLPKYTGLKGRGIKEANFTVINTNSVPAVLVEGGFMDSNIDYKVITSEEGQDGYARAVAEGLIEFLGLKKKENEKPNMKYEVHVQNIGWQGEKINGQLAGTEGQGLRIEALKIYADIPVQYRVYVESQGWTEWVPNGCEAGTTGKSLKIEAIEIISSKNPIKATAHFENVGWESSIVGTQIKIGSEGRALRLEALKLEFV